MPPSLCDLAPASAASHRAASLEPTADRLALELPEVEAFTRFVPRAASAAPSIEPPPADEPVSRALQLHDAHRWEEAASAYAAVLDNLPADSDQWETAARLHNNYAMVLRELDRSAEAEEHYIKALLAYDAAPQKEVADEITALLGNLAFLHFDSGLHAEALKVQNRALAVCRLHRPQLRATLGRQERRAGIFAWFADQADEALEHFTTALDLISQAQEERSPEGIELLVNLAATHLKRGDHANALAFSGRAAQRLDEAPNGDKLLLAAVLNNIGCLQIHQGRHDEARDALNWGLRLLKEHPVSDDTALAEMYHNLTIAHEALGNRTSAALYRRLARELFASIGDDCRAKLQLAESRQQAVSSSSARPLAATAAQTFMRSPFHISHTTPAGAMALPMKTETVDWEFDALANAVK